MANQKKQNRKKPGGYKSTVSPKKKRNLSKQAHTKTPGGFKLKQVIIGLSVIVLISAAMIAYFTLQDKQIDTPRNKTLKVANSVKKSNPESNRKEEQNKPGNNTGKNASPTAPVIQFKKTVHDYGTIQKGSDGICEFGFKNTGKDPLVLSNVKSSCGCTVPTWPREPVLAGHSDVIKVVYDTKRVGIINKFITVSSNASNDIVRLSIKGQVVAN